MAYIFQRYDIKHTINISIYRNVLLIDKQQYALFLPVQLKNIGYGPGNRSYLVSIHKWPFLS